MKNTLFIALLCLGLNMNAQAKKDAKKITNEITELIELSKSDSEKVYTIALDKTESIEAYEKANPGLDKKVLKKNIRSFNRKFDTELNEIIGEENMATYEQYLKKKKEEKREMKKKESA